MDQHQRAEQGATGTEDGEAESKRHQVPPLTGLVDGRSASVAVAERLSAIPAINGGHRARACGEGRDQGDPRIAHSHIRDRSEGAYSGGESVHPPVDYRM
jgi:hypothetical protein